MGYTNRITFKCKGCDALITESVSEHSNGSGKIYCSKNCRLNSTNVIKKCIFCSNEFKIWKSRKDLKNYCSLKCYGIASRKNEVVEYNSNNYYRTSGGYYVSRPDGIHGVMLHRQIYEDFHKIKLTDRQTLHHINGIRNDNRVENLELWQNRHPKGTRVSDKTRVKNFCPECPHCTSVEIINVR